MKSFENFIFTLPLISRTILSTLSTSLVWGQMEELKCQPSLASTEKIVLSWIEKKISSEDLNTESFVCTNIACIQFFSVRGEKLPRPSCQAGLFLGDTWILSEKNKWRCLCLIRENFQMMEMVFFRFWVKRIKLMNHWWKLSSNWLPFRFASPYSRPSNAKMAIVK